MNLDDHRCFFCLGQRIEKLLAYYGATSTVKRQVVTDIAQLYADRGHTISPPEFNRELYRYLHFQFPHQSPFWAQKKLLSDKALEVQTDLRRRIRMLGHSFQNALRVSLMASGLDMAPLSPAQLLDYMDRGFRATLSVDHSALLKARVRSGCTVLFLGDRAGEIVLDRLFIRFLRAANVVYVVRDQDMGLSVSQEDADYVRMEAYATVLPDGCNGPATLLSHASEALQRVYQWADVIIAKGCTHLESLYSLHDPRLFVLMRCACPVVASALSVPEGSYLVVNPVLRQAELDAQVKADS
jgi:hypothetical protein